MAPTVTVLAVIKARLLGATKGHALLKKKADALNMRFRQILKKIVQTKEEMGKVMKASFFSLAQARYSSGEFKHTVFDSVDQVRCAGAYRAGGRAGEAGQGGVCHQGRAGPSRHELRRQQAAAPSAAEQVCWRVLRFPRATTALEWPDFGPVVL